VIEQKNTIINVKNKFMKKLNYLFYLFIAILALCNPLRVRAEAFVISLYYNSATQSLSFDESLGKKVAHDQNVASSIYDFAHDNTVGQYILRLYDSSGESAVEKEFNKQDGRFSLIIPYFSIARELKIFDKNSNKELLSVDLSAFTTCNGNGVCEFEQGETGQNCIGDCAGGKNKYSQQTLRLLERGDGAIRDANTGEILLAEENLPSGQTAPTATTSGLIYYIIFSLIIFLGLPISYMIYRKYNNG
jgi:hypothetical protein